MTKRQSRQVAWTLRGVALLALAAYVPGARAAESGGLVRVEAWFNHPWLLFGAVLLTVASLVVELEFRTAFSQIGFAAVLVALMYFGAPYAFAEVVFSDIGDAPATRLAAPGRDDRSVTVTNVAFGIDPIYRVELRSGTGWSERHWDLGEFDEGEQYRDTAWTGPNEITVTREDSRTVYTLDPTTGRPGEPRQLPR